MSEREQRTDVILFIASVSNVDVVVILTVSCLILTVSVSGTILKLKGDCERHLT